MLFFWIKFRKFKLWLWYFLVIEIINCRLFLDNLCFVCWYLENILCSVMMCNCRLLGVFWVVSKIWWIFESYGLCLVVGFCFVWWLMILFWSLLIWWLKFFICVIIVLMCWVCRFSFLISCMVWWWWWESCCYVRWCFVLFWFLLSVR